MKKKKVYKKLNGRHMHRVIAEQKIGRALLPGEIVHHIDDNHLNNHPDNLEVLASQAEHARLHSTKNRKCSLEGCKNKHYSKGLCNIHWQRQHYYGRTELLTKELKTCSIESCDSTHYALGLCNRHWQAFKKYDNR